MTRKLNLRGKERKDWKERRKKDERKLNLFRVENKYMKVTC